ncbi:MAG: hypothetical protein GDA51_00940 [Ekhidna sp.]|nr:hypothetical protein [Ekhidna sp.]
MTKFTFCAGSVVLVKVIMAYSVFPALGGVRKNVKIPELTSVTGADKRIRFGGLTETL